MPSVKESATKDFHSALGIPDGATLTVEASEISGNVQATATFLSGAEGVDDAEWTLDDMENGRAHTDLAGPGISMARVRLAMNQGAQSQFDMIIRNQGEVIRHRIWRLNAEGGDRAGRLGLLISVKGPGQ